MNVLQRIIVPQESVNDQTLVVLELTFQSGNAVTKGAMIAELETSKTTISVEADVDGYVTYFCEAGDELEVNALIAEITDEPQVVTPSKIPPVEKLQKSIDEHVIVQVDETLFSTEALNAISKYNISREQFKGKDFVTSKDVDFFVHGYGSNNNKSNGVTKKEVTTKKSNPVAAASDKVQLKKVSSFKSKEIEYLSDVQSSGVVSTIHAFINTEGVTQFLNLHLRYLKDSLLPAIITESSKLLKKYPLFNGYYNGDTVALYNNVNIGFAVDMERGLKVLKIADTDTRTLLEVEKEIFELSGAYLDEKLKTENLTDVTFTITDLSGEGVFTFTPLVNSRNSAILGVSAIDPKLNRCVVTLAFDHRVTEGKQAAIFLSELKERIESYVTPQGSADIKVAWANTITCYKCRKSLSEDLSDTGFARVLTRDGQEGYICQSCFKGF